MIAYKVVNSKRKSVLAEPGSKYCLTYKKGTTVIAPRNTLGIMCFKTKIKARIFINTMQATTWKIIKVSSGEEEASYPDFVSKSTFKNSLDLFYKISPNHRLLHKYYKGNVITTNPWPATICFNQIKVLT